VGFRAGTTQPFRPLTTERMLELPLNIQDSAMFYPNRMMLSETEALTICKAIMRSMSSYGGALTVNWHTRSLSPERLWDEFYTQLLQEIRKYRVWFGTAQDVVGWFRKRRRLRFQSLQDGKQGVTVSVISPDGYSEPPFTVRIYQGRCVYDKSVSLLCTPAFTDHQWNGEHALEAIV